MESLETSEAKARFLELLERVERGEEFTITEHGKPVARLLPIPEIQTKQDVQAVIEAMKAFRKGRSLDGLSIREMIEEGRRF